MKRYKVTVMYSVFNTYIVEADSYEEAEMMFPNTNEEGTKNWKSEEEVIEIVEDEEA